MHKGTENLIPLNQRSKEELREITSKGGKACVELKRRRKTLREELLLLLEEADTQKNISVAMIQKAMNGDTKAFEIIRDTVGEKPTDKIEQVNINTNEAYKELSAEELKKLAGE